MVSALFAFLATYAIHSSVFLLLAELASRMRKLTPAGRDVLWKAALLGGIASSLVASAGAPRTERMTFSLPPVVLDQQPADRAPGATATETPAALGAPRPDRPGGTTSKEREIPVELLAVSAWLLGALLLLMRLATRHRSVVRQLASRTRLSSGGLAAELSALLRRAGVRRPIRLSVTPGSAMPLALGLSEICVPERFQMDLDSREREAALAHELAHLVRRDPLWNMAGHLLEALFFFQPLNRLASSRIRSAAELCSDDWAARRLGSGTDLARSLTTIATWVNDSRIAARLVSAIAGREEPLSKRVERLLRGPSGRKVIPVGVSFVLVFFAVAAMAPAVIPKGLLPSALAEGVPDEEGRYTWRGGLVTGSVEVKTPVGDIRFSRSSSAEVEIEAVADGREFRKARIAVVEHRHGLTVCAVFPPAPGMPENRCEPGPWRVHSSTTQARVDFHVKLPAGVGAAAHGMTGDVLVSSPPADAAIRTETGSIALVLEQPGWRGRADLANRSGDITIRHSRVEAIRIDARSTHGQVETDQSLEGLPGESRGPAIEGVHGGVPTGASVRARSEFGKIDLRVW